MPIVARSAHKSISRLFSSTGRLFAVELRLAKRRPRTVLDRVTAPIAPRPIVGARSRRRGRRELVLEQAHAVLTLSTARQGSEPIMPEPHADQLQRLGLP